MRYICTPNNFEINYDKIKFSVNKRIEILELPLTEGK